MGSNGTSGTGASNSSNSWAGRLEKSLRSERDGLETLGFINHGHDGYSTKDLFEGKKIEEVINDNPDLVIFENPLINNHYQSISLEKTEKELKLAGAETVLFDKFMPNPLKQTIMEGAAFAKENHCDFIVALGGRSIRGNLSRNIAFGGGVAVTGNKGRYGYDCSREKE